MQASDETASAISNALDLAVSRAPIALRALLIASPEGHVTGITRLGLRVLSALDEAGWDLDGDDALNMVVAGMEAAGASVIADLVVGMERARIDVAQRIATELNLHSAKLAKRDLVG